MMQCHAVRGMDPLSFIYCAVVCVEGLEAALKSQRLVTFRIGLESRVELCGISLPTAGLPCQE